MDLAEFLERYSEDDNQWWRLDVGDMQNLFDAAVQQAAELQAEVARLRDAIEGMADAYAAYHGRFGGSGVANELRAILTNGAL